MTTLLTRGLTFHRRAMASAAGVAITYHRGPSHVHVTAVVVELGPGLDEYGAVLVDLVRRDYLITAADLLLDGVAVLPSRGDRVREIIAGKTEVYEVLPLGDRAWYEADVVGGSLTIHCKHVGTE